MSFLELLTVLHTQKMANGPPLTRFASSGSNLQLHHCLGQSFSNGALGPHWGPRAEACTR